MQTPRVSRAPGGLACLALACFTLIGRTADAAPAATPSPSSALASATAPAPGDRELPLPVVGRWAETLPLHGGPVRDSFRVPLPDRPWLTEAWRSGGLVLHAGLALEGGWSNNPFPSYGPYEFPVGLLRIAPEARLAGSHTTAGRTSVAWDLALGFNYEAWFPEVHPGRPAHDLELRLGGGLEVRTPGGSRFRPRFDYRRWEWRQQGALVPPPMDVADLRIEGEVPLGRRGALDLGYRLVAYVQEGETSHPALAEQHQLHLHPQGRLARGLRLGVRGEAEIVRFGSGLRSAFLPDVGITARAILTLEGRLRPWLGYRLGLGWGGGFFPADASGRQAVSTHTAVAHAGAAFRLAPATWLHVGYWRDLEPLGVYADFLRTGVSSGLPWLLDARDNLAQVDAAFLTLSSRIRRLSLRLALGWRSWAFAGDERVASVPVSSHCTGACRLHDLLTEVGVDYYVARGVSLGATYLLQLQRPRAGFTSDPDPGLTLGYVGYLQHRVVARGAMRF